MPRFPSGDTSSTSGTALHRLGVLCVVFVLASMGIGAQRVADPAESVEFEAAPRRHSLGVAQRGNTDAGVETEVLGATQSAPEPDASTGLDGGGASAVAPAPTDPPTASTSPSTAPVAPSGPTSTVAVGSTPSTPTTGSPSSTTPTSATSPTTAPVLSPGAPVQPSTLSVADRVMAEINYPWQQRLPGWRIEFVGARKGLRGATFPNERLIQIYQRPDLSFAELVHVTAHEIGHALDVEWLTDDERLEWLDARGAALEVPWWVADGANDFASGAGDWAEVFAWSQLPQSAFSSSVAGRPSAEQQNLMWRLIG